VFDSPHFCHVLCCQHQKPNIRNSLHLCILAGDEAGAEELRKQLLKGKLQMAGQSQRAGAAAAGRPPTGQQAGKAAGKAGSSKRSTKRK
jgi:hypothetical protein